MRRDLRALVRRGRAWPGREALQRPDLRPLALATLAASALTLLPLWLVPLPARLDAPHSPVVLYGDGSPAHVFLSQDDKQRLATLPAHVDPGYRAALLRFEDKRFLSHPGVDPLAVGRAVAQNLRHGRVVSGASTLTLQLVRLLEPRPRTLGAKVVEAWRAVQLELHLTKEEILGHYLTFAPYGGNLEGVEAASWAFFGHGAGRLAPEEIAVLLAVPQAPGSRAPAPHRREALRLARDGIAAWLLAEGALPTAGRDTATVLAEVRAAPVPAAPRPLPREGPHAAYWLRSRHPQAARVETSLDPAIQRRAEHLVAREAAGLAARGIDHAAIVVLEHGTGRVRALAGSPGFYSGRPGTQIASFAEPRSPGSALKPFLYALALDGGVALPEHLVGDVPRTWAGYRPENYDGVYEGLVTLEDALARSRNLPFVALLERVGVEPFLTAIRGAGAGNLRRDAGFYGLSAALGAVEISPLEMAGIYAGLAAGGRVVIPRWSAGPETPTGPHWLSPGAAWLTRRALARRDRPDLPRGRGGTLRPDIHWKTGTSYGHRDAWAVGSGPRHTAVVWLGNLDRRPSVDLVGADAAGPLLFDLLEGLDRSWAEPAAPPPDLALVEVCADSGYLPGAACPRRQEVLAPRRAVSPTLCRFHRRVEVDLATGLALRPGCRAGRASEPRTYFVPPEDVRSWLARSGRWTGAPPAWDPGCPPAAGAEGLAIVSPAAGEVVLLLPGVPTGRQEVPFRAAGGADGPLAWFVDGAWLGEAPGHAPYWWEPRPGRHRITVTDRSGRSASQELEVRAPERHVARSRAGPAPLLQSPR